MRWSFFLIISFFVLSCTRKVEYIEFKALDKNSWSQNDSLLFKVEVKDTLSAYNLLIHLRHSGQYQYRNIWVQSRIEQPDGEVSKIRSNLPLADKSGAWNGSGLGDLVDHRFMILKNRRFKKKGTYLISVRHLLWDKELEQILDVGVELEQVPN